MKGFTYLFSLLLFANGVVAYVRKGSKASLMGASGFAVLLLLAANLMQPTTRTAGTALALGE
jgi:uncharacterized membrane protein (UPF0136 family)